MDFMPDKEFHVIFNRVSRTIDLKGAGTPSEIHERLKNRIKIYQRQEKELEKPIQAKKRISNLKKLIFSGFGRRTIDEAVAKPHGKVALTLRHGREKARDILLVRSRKRIGSLRYQRQRRRRRKR